MRRRTYWFVGLIAAVAVAVAAAWRFTLGAAQPPEDPEHAPGKNLPLSQVILFNSGVGYFQREGAVEGDARVDLTFPVSDVNDLLKSLVLPGPRRRQGQHRQLRQPGADGEDAQAASRST